MHMYTVHYESNRSHSYNDGLGWLFASLLEIASSDNYNRLNMRYSSSHPYNDVWEKCYYHVCKDIIFNIEQSETI
jgi:hypothetical protein